jgi:hypothetical protein
MQYLENINTSDEIILACLCFEKKELAKRNTETFTNAINYIESGIQNNPLVVCGQCTSQRMGHELIIAIVSYRYMRESFYYYTIVYPNSAPSLSCFPVWKTAQ